MQHVTRKCRRSVSQSLDIAMMFTFILYTFIVRTAQAIIAKQVAAWNESGVCKQPRLEWESSSRLLLLQNHMWCVDSDYLRRV